MGVIRTGDGFPVRSDANRISTVRSSETNAVAASSGVSTYGGP